jgi:hypothetical protein
MLSGLDHHHDIHPLDILNIRRHVDAAGDGDVLPEHDGNPALSPGTAAQLYNMTLDSFLGASYCMAAGFDGLNIVGMAFIWIYIARFHTYFPRDKSFYAGLILVFVQTGETVGAPRGTEERKGIRKAIYCLHVLNSRDIVLNIYLFMHI